MAKGQISGAGVQPINEGKAAEKVVITSGMSDEVMLDLDQKGYRLCFAHEKGSFKELSEETIKALSPLTRAAYAAVYEIAMQESRIDRNFAPGLEFVRGAINPSSAHERIHGTQLKPGLEGRFSRDDLLQERLEDGWRYAKSDDVVKSKAEVLNGKRILRLPTGQVESVLLVKDADTAQAKREAKVAERQAAATQATQATAAQVASLTKTPAKPL